MDSQYFRKQDWGSLAYPVDDLLQPPQRLDIVIQIVTRLSKQIKTATSIFSFPNTIKDWNNLPYNITTIYSFIRTPYPTCLTPS